MALTIPDADSVIEFWGDDAPMDAFDPRVPAMTQVAADLLWLATEIDADPVDPRWFRLEQAAIKDLTIYLLVSREAPSENYTGMQGERIGSYSYSKAMARSAMSATTGAELFDRFVVAWNARGEDTVGSLLASAENVFASGWQTPNLTENLLHRQPVYHEAVFGL